jgi:hypothetical protein
MTVTLGVLSWAVLPVVSFSLNSDTGSSTCRMACADTAHCCCKPAAAANATKHDPFPETELSALATLESCPRDCATLTIVPGTSTARSARGVERLAAPGVEPTSRAVEPHTAIHQGLFDVAQPRGPPTRGWNDLFIARTSSDTPIACASLLSEFSITTRLDSTDFNQADYSVNKTRIPSARGV